MPVPAVSGGPTGLLLELNISNYAVIDRLSISFRPGFNVLTGETGAGKSIILDALGLLLGDKSHAEMVRAGADQAWVEGIFDVSGSVAGELSELLDLDVATEGFMMSREIGTSGRSICRINGRSFPLRKLAEAGTRLVDIHGQSEHLSLLHPSRQLELLDRYGDLLESRTRYAALVRELAGLRQQERALELATQALERQRELLTFQTMQIAAASLVPGEEEALLAERAQRLNAERIRELASQASAALEADDQGLPGAQELIARAVTALASLERLQPSIGHAREAAESAALQLEEVAREVRSFGEGMEFDQRRLDEIQERLALISSLKRKYGGTVEEVIRFGQQAAARLAEVEAGGATRFELRSRQDALVGQAAQLAAEISVTRRHVACAFTLAAGEELQRLGMPACRLAVRLRYLAASDGLPWAGLAPAQDAVVESGTVELSSPAEGGRLKFDTTGVDRVEFLIAPNPGEPLKPLAAIASGGETSRLMLGLKTVLSAADFVPTLVFDEIDAGIGGKVGEVVGQRLWSLGRLHQVLVVTHLPQIASFGDRHFCVRKLVNEGRTSTQVLPVTGEDRVSELTAMLGSDTPATRRKAAELLSASPSGARDPR